MAASATSCRARARDAATACPTQTGRDRAGHLKKSLEHFLPSDLAPFYGFIATQAEHFAVRDLCQALAVSRSGHYAWQQRPTANDPLTEIVRAAFWRHARRYGARRLRAELQAAGHVIGRRRLRRSRQTENLQAMQPKSFVPCTTNSRHGARMSPYLLTDWRVSAPHQVYVSDITYLPLVSGEWAYLATWLDLYTRRIVGWAMAETMTADLIIRALQQAIGRACPP